MADDQSLEPVTFRTTPRKVARLNDVAISENRKRSQLLDKIVTEYLENKERTRTPLYRTPEVEEVAKLAKAAIDAALSGYTLPMKKAVGHPKQRRHVA